MLWIRSSVKIGTCIGKESFLVYCCYYFIILLKITLEMVTFNVHSLIQIEAVGIITMFFDRRVEVAIGYNPADLLHHRAIALSLPHDLYHEMQHG